MSPNLKGALLMTASMGSFTLNDVFVKLLAEDMPLFQIVFLRSVLTAILLAIAAAALGQLRLRPGPGDRARLTLRTIFEIATMVAFLYALVNMPIANATAILAALPLSVTVAAAVFLKEPLGWRRISAVLVGFFGVMLIVQPGTGGFNAFSLSALLAVVFITGRDLFTRRMGPGLPSLSVALVTALAVGAFSLLLSLLEPWAPLDLRAGALIACSAVFIIGGYLFSIMVMRVGEVSVVAPFRYTGLVFALVFGLLFFAEWPNALALSGAGIVVATGIYTILRERAVAARIRASAKA
jgi:drug/metabolite transporter (DMT)-like permease